jgi:hypothetical protein
MPTFAAGPSPERQQQASHSGRRISMNCGIGDTLSSRPMANVSQTIQPLREA